MVFRRKTRRVLAALAAFGEQTGYELSKSANIGVAVYSILRRLEHDEWVSVRADDKDERARFYYSLTDQGWRQARERYDIRETPDEHGANT